MNYRRIINTNFIVRNFIDDHVEPGNIVLDCTVGNGNDTIELARKVGAEGRVYGFDIQSLAIENTRNLLNKENLLDRVILIKDSHENIDLYINQGLDLVIYNLGYLPKGDKTIITRRNSTVISVKKALNLLKPEGLMLVTVYIGHEGGTEEMEGLNELLSSLNQKEYNVLRFNFINQINNPPVLYSVEKSFREVY